MSDHEKKLDVMVIPCSGVGKVHGLISREAVYRVTDSLRPGQADTVCLALLVTGDAEARQKVTSGKALLVCAYESEALCRRNHPEGGLSLADFMARVPSLDKEQELIFYCV